MSRNEDILQAIINSKSLEDFRPQSRMEALLLQLGGSGGGSGEVVELLLSFKDNTITTPTLTNESNISFINLLEKIKAKQPNSITLSPIIMNMEGASQGLYGNLVGATISEIGEMILGSLNVTVNSNSLLFGILRTSDDNATFILGENFDVTLVSLLDGQTLKFYLN